MYAIMLKSEQNGTLESTSVLVSIKGFVLEVLLNAAVITTF